jgi:hypothetical protein
MLVTLLTAVMVSACTPEPPPVPTPSRPTPVPDACERGPWVDRCPEAEWLRRALGRPDHYAIAAETGDTFIVSTPTGQVRVWAVTHERELAQGERFPDRVHSGDFRQVDLRDHYQMYTDGTRFVWMTQGVRVWVVGETHAISADDALGLRRTVERTSYLECADVPLAELDPHSGRAGDDLTLTVRVMGSNKGGGMPVTTDYVEVWWNLNFESYGDVLSTPPRPSPAVAGDVSQVLAQPIDHACAPRVTFPIPDVPPGTYPVALVNFTGDRDLGWGASGFPLGEVTVEP